MKAERLKRSFAAITPAVVDYRDELPFIPPEKIADECITVLGQANASLLLVMKVAVIFLNVISLFLNGKLLKNMDKEKQERFLGRCSRSRFQIMRGLITLVKLPITLFYYAQDEACFALGYNREELCADAEKHQVTR